MVMPTSGIIKLRNLQETPSDLVAGVQFNEDKNLIIKDAEYIFSTTDLIYLKTERKYYRTIVSTGIFPRFTVISFSN